MPCYISNSVSHYLLNIKERIEQYPNEWDVYKKYTNPYEYIHSIVPIKKKSVSKWKPLSRSYFKMVEMIHSFDLLNFMTKPLIQSKSFARPTGVINKTNYYLYENSNQSEDNEEEKTEHDFTNIKSNTRQSHPFRTKYSFCYSNRGIETNQFEDMNTISTPIRTFHLAEGPGGFIQALLELRNNPFDKYIGMTIVDEKDGNVPSWKKSDGFLKKYCNNVFIENGVDKTGNILHLCNFVGCVEKYGNSMDFITADGGFDFSFDFNSQETHIIRLLFSQIAFAVCMQKKGGTFILKVFDCFMLHTLDILYLLSSFYENTYLCKPETSRYANSEKYIVCKNFLFSSNTDYFPFFYRCFQKMSESPFQKPIARFLNIPLSNLFMTNLEEMNCIFAQQQIENIYNTISLIENNPNLTKRRSQQTNDLAKRGIESNKHYFNENTPFIQENIPYFIKNNVKKSTQWCKQYNIPYNILYVDIC